jgi:hypothetical protein
MLSPISATPTSRPRTRLTRTLPGNRSAARARPCHLTFREISIPFYPGIREGHWHMRQHHARPTRWRARLLGRCGPSVVLVARRLDETVLKAPAERRFSGLPPADAVPVRLPQATGRRAGRVTRAHSGACVRAMRASYWDRDWAPLRNHDRLQLRRVSGPQRTGKGVPLNVRSMRRLWPNSSLPATRTLPNFSRLASPPNSAIVSMSGYTFTDVGT